MLVNKCHAVVVKPHHSTISEQLNLDVGEEVFVHSLLSGDLWAWSTDKRGVFGYVCADHLKRVTKQEDHNTQDTADDDFESDSEQFGIGDQSGYEAGNDEAMMIYEEHCADGGSFYKVVMVDSVPTAESLTLRVGEIVMAVADLGHTFLRVRSCRLLNTEGIVRKIFLKKATPLEGQPWFLGKISRHEAEVLLNQESIGNKSFLVRESENTSGYVLSIKHSEAVGTQCVRHRRIKNNSNRTFTAWDGYELPNLIELVVKHMTQEGGNYLGTPYNK